jgi:uncharacterized protein DUF6084
VIDVTAADPALARAASPPELSFAVEDAQPHPSAAVPTIVLRLAVERAAGGPVRSATIAVRVDVAAARRTYDAAAQERLRELFGEPGQWGSTLGTLFWTRVTVLVGPFADRTAVDVPLPCTYDFDVAAAKYLQALEGGDVALDLMFSGTVLYDDGGRVQAAPIPWDSQASHRMPVAVWREAMERVFGDSAWLRVDRATFDRLCAYKVRRGLATWESALDALLGEEPAWPR